MNEHEGRAARQKGFLILATPLQATPPFTETILLQRNENYLTCIIHIGALLFSRTLSCDVEEILVLVAAEFSPSGLFCCGIYLKWELKCLVELVPSLLALLLMFLEASATL
jgi:hypothetical protein